jgi:hypothetical protein
MKRIWRSKDKHRNSIEIYVLERNNKVPEDLIYLRIKQFKKREFGIVMQPWEARNVIAGLFLAIDEIIEQYKLEKFKIKK